MKQDQNSVGYWLDQEIGWKEKVLAHLPGHFRTPYYQQEKVVGVTLAQALHEEQNIRAERRHQLSLNSTGYSVSFKYSNNKAISGHAACQLGGVFFDRRYCDEEEKDEAHVKVYGPGWSQEYALTELIVDFSRHFDMKSIRFQQPWSPVQHFCKDNNLPLLEETDYFTRYSLTPDPNTYK